MKTLILIAAITLTPQQQDSLCYAIADFSVATIEAREAGVPIDQVLRLTDDMPPMFREGVIATYAEPSMGITLTDADRQQLINRFTAECLSEQ